MAASETIQNPSRGLRHFLQRSGEVALAGITSAFAAPQSTIFILGDGHGWSLSDDARILYRQLSAQGVKSRLLLSGSSRGVRGQILHHFSQFFLSSISQQELRTSSHTFSYYHGRPHPDYPEFEECLDSLLAHIDLIARVHVSCVGMRDFLQSTGIPESKLHIIPIPVDPEVFHPESSEVRQKLRARYGIPQDTTVVGSFQKDGKGWGEGLEPKLIKGPDVLVEVMSRLNRQVPKLHVLLVGPARGFVKREFDRGGIAYTALSTRSSGDIAPLYQICDAVVVTSREEGGPKAVLEAMASGVPIVSTKVGQAADIIKSGENGFLTAVEDVDGLVNSLRAVFETDSSELTDIITRARGVSERNSIEALAPHWKEFFSEVQAD